MRVYVCICMCEVIPCEAQNMGARQIHPFRYSNEYIFVGYVFSHVGCCLYVGWVKCLRLCKRVRLKIVQLSVRRERKLSKAKTICPIRFPKPFNLPTPSYSYFWKKWVLDPIFRIFSALRVDHRPFKNIGV